MSVRGQDITLEDFLQLIESYMVWYRDTRINLSLGRLNPSEYKTILEVVL